MTPAPLGKDPGGAFSFAAGRGLVRVGSDSPRRVPGRRMALLYSGGIARVSTRAVGWRLLFARSSCFGLKSSQGSARAGQGGGDAWLGVQGSHRHCSQGADRDLHLLLFLRCGRQDVHGREDLPVLSLRSLRRSRLNAPEELGEEVRHRRNRLGRAPRALVRESKRTAYWPTGFCADAPRIQIRIR